MIAFALLPLLSVGCHVEPIDTTPKKAQLEIPVPGDANTFTIAPVSWPDTVRTQGSLAADERSVVSSKVPGRVEDTLVDLGDTVPKGQPLARLEMRDFELGVLQAEAELAEACALIGLEPNASTDDVDPELVPSVAVERATWDEATEALQRMEKLQRTRSISESEYRRQSAAERVAKAKYDSAVRNVDRNKALIETRRVQLEVANQNLEDATIRAPFDGVIQSRHLAAGTFVQAGAPVFTIVRIDPLRFQGRIPERKANAVRVGQTASIKVEGVEKDFEATLIRVSPSLDIASRSLQVEAEVSNADGRFRSGLYAEGLIVVDPDATTIAIPPAALGEFAGVHKVWVVRDGLLVSQRVSLGEITEDFVEITSGIATGDELLSDFQAGETARRNAGNKPTDQPKDKPADKNASSTAESPDSQKEAKH